MSIISIIDPTKNTMYAKCYLLCTVDGEFRVSHVSNADIWFVDKAGSTHSDMLYQFDHNDAVRIISITLHGRICDNPIVVEANVPGTTRGMFTMFREFYKEHVGK